MNSLVRKRHKHVVFSAGSRGHMFLCIIKLVVAGLAACDELSKWVVLCDEKPSKFKHYWSHQKSSTQLFVVLFKDGSTYQACDKGQGTGVVPDRPEIVTFRQVSAEGDIGGNVLSGVHGVACLAHTVDSGLDLENNSWWISQYISTF